MNNPTSLTSPAPASDAVRPARRQRGLATASSVLFGLGTGSAVAAWLDLLLLPRPAVLWFLGLGVLSLIAAVTGGSSRSASPSLRPVVYLLSAVGFLVLDVGLIQLIMTFAWR